MKDRKSKESKY